MPNPTREQRRELVMEIVSARLDPGESVDLLTPAMAELSRLTRLTLGPASLLKLQPWYLVLTDRRLVAVPMDFFSGRPTSVDWDEPRTRVRVVKFRRGPLTDKLYLRRLSDGRELKLRVNFRYRNDALSLKAALEG